MAASTATKRRPRNKAAAGHVSFETFTKDAVLLLLGDNLGPDGKRLPVLDDLLTADGFTSFETKAKALNYPSTGMLHRAFKGGAVSPALICAARRRYPHLSYEQLFCEGQATGKREVPVDAPADLAA